MIGKKFIIKYKLQLYIRLKIFWILATNSYGALYCKQKNCGFGEYNIINSYTSAFCWILKSMVMLDIYLGWV